MLKCVACGEELEKGVTPCPNCELQNSKLCKLCKRRIPRDARFCNECKSHQKRWLYRLFLVVTALGPLGAAFGIPLSLVNLALALNRTSNTHMKLLATESDKEAIRAMVWNSGQEASWLLSAKLIFEDGRVAPVDLTLAASEKCGTNLVKAGEAVTICFESDPVRFYKTDKWGLIFHPKAKGLALVVNRKVTLQIHVEESNDPGPFGLRLRTNHTMKETFNESVIDAFLKEVSP